LQERIGRVVRLMNTSGFVISDAIAYAALAALRAHWLNAPYPGPIQDLKMATEVVNNVDGRKKKLFNFNG
jgi:hypothetical protein